MAEAKGSTTPQERGQRGQEQESRSQELGRTGQGSLQRRSNTPEFAASPFGLMRRIADEMDRAFDRMFDDFGFSSRRLMPRGAFGSSAELATAVWSPRIEAYQEGDRFIVRAELPGLKKNDVDVNISEEAITIRGQRRQERKEEREGFYHSELSYGSFYRAIPLPGGAIPDSAEATFKNGVLDIRLQVPPEEVSGGRKIEIKDA